MYVHLLNLFVSISALLGVTEQLNIGIVSSCRHHTEFSKAIAYNLAKEDKENVYIFLTDEYCSESIKIPNVETFSKGIWFNSTEQTSAAASDQSSWGSYIYSYSNSVQVVMDEVVRSAETLQRLLEQKSVELLFIDSYMTCAATVAEVHDIPVVLLHNTGMPNPTSNLVRVEVSFYPSFFYQYMPEFLIKIANQGLMVMFKNLPDVRMAISVGNKCSLDLQTNKSHSTIPHFWASYPRVAPFIHPLVGYHKKTKHFTPLGLPGLVEKGKPKSNRLEKFMNSGIASNSEGGVYYVYFTGEQELIDVFGLMYFYEVFTDQNVTFKTIWTNSSNVPNKAPFVKADSASSANQNILFTPLTVHSVMTEKRIDVIVGSCSVDNLLRSLHYEKVLVCFETEWRESALSKSISKAEVAVTLWPRTTTTVHLTETIKRTLANRDMFNKQILSHKKSQRFQMTLLKDLVAKLTLLPSSTWKKYAVDPINHGIEFGILILTFIMMLRFFIRTGRKVFGSGPSSTKKKNQSNSNGDGDDDDDAKRQSEKKSEKSTADKKDE